MSLVTLFNNVKHAAISPFESKSKAPAQAKASTAQAHDTNGNSQTGNSSGQASITSNDFLTLLVTEIQNQDPTTQTDPMQYITQLVGVNSLEQLIQINQTLSSSAGAVPGAAGQSYAPATNSQTRNANSAFRANNPVAVSNPNAAAAARMLPLNSNSQIPSSAQNAVANALTQSSVPLPQALPPTQIPMSPEVMHALQRSIPGASFAGQGVPAVPAPEIGGAGR